eukprot:1139522-Pelagomonas_calceolata.AAC.3
MELANPTNVQCLSVTGNLELNGKSHVSSENKPYINQGKGDTLAHRAESLPHQRGTFPGG